MGKGVMQNQNFFFKGTNNFHQNITELIKYQ